MNILRLEVEGERSRKICVKVFGNKVIQSASLPPILRSFPGKKRME
jgi:hypothetical protein